MKLNYKRKGEVEFFKVFSHEINMCKYLMKRSGADIWSNFLVDLLVQRKDPFSTCPIKKVSFFQITIY